MSAKSTKKTKSAENDTLRPNYTRASLGKGVRGKHYGRYGAGTNLVALAPDVAEVFETPQAVNDALRSLIAIAEKTAHAATGSKKTRKATPQSVSSQP